MDMKSENKNDKKADENLKVEWFGVDGALLLLFAALAVVYGYGLLNRVDFILGILAPGIALTITTGVFIKYCTEVFSFAKGKKKKEDEV